MAVDEKDLRILRALAECGSVSPDEIHVHTGIPKSTIHYRLNRLRADGILQNDLGDVDLDRLGLSLTVISEVDAAYSPGYQETVGAKLAAVDGVNHVYFVMGDTDFVVISHLPTRDRIDDLIESFEAIEEIERTSSKFVIKTVHASHSVLLDYDESVLRTELTGTDDRPQPPDVEAE